MLFKFPFPQILLVSTITFSLVTFRQLPAQSYQVNLTTSMRSVQSTLEQEPENRGAPDDRTGAGTRIASPVDKY